MPTYTNYALTDDEKIKYGERLTHYIEEFLYHKKVQVTEGAKLLGISTTKFSQLKCGWDQGRFLTSMDYLTKLAKLENMDIADFVSYIKGRDSDKTKFVNYTWNEKIYKALEPACIMYRKEFADSLEKAASEVEQKRIELMLRLVTGVDDKGLEALEHMVKDVELQKEERKRLKEKINETIN